MNHLFLSGDYYGSGTIRKLELNEACEIFGLSAENIIVINDRYANYNGDWKVHYVISIITANYRIILVPAGQLKSLVTT